MGIPLLLISASMALVEERARGSLDILLTTPITSRTVVLAKWWSVFRLTAQLLLFPLIVAVSLKRHVGLQWNMLLFPFYLTSACAMWTSVGLLLSTWTARIGRAVTSSVVLFTIFSLGLPIMSLSVLPRPFDVGFSVVSPFYGTFYLLASMNWGDGPIVAAFALFWTIVQSILAAVLLFTTLRIFDRRIGRISDHARPELQAPLSMPAALRTRIQQHHPAENEATEALHTHREKSLG
jgi:ABC-type transport system involved in multi-copper enzyme maturation permease subunit